MYAVSAHRKVSRALRRKPSRNPAAPMALRPLKEPWVLRLRSIGRTWKQYVRPERFRTRLLKEVQGAERLLLIPEALLPPWPRVVRSGWRRTTSGVRYMSSELYSRQEFEAAAAGRAENECMTTTGGVFSCTKAVATAQTTQGRKNSNRPVCHANSPQRSQSGRGRWRQYRP